MWSWVSDEKIFTKTYIGISENIITIMDGHQFIWNILFGLKMGLVFLFNGSLSHPLWILIYWIWSWKCEVEVINECKYVCVFLIFVRGGPLLGGPINKIIQDNLVLISEDIFEKQVSIRRSYFYTIYRYILYIVCGKYIDIIFRDINTI